MKKKILTAITVLIALLCAAAMLFTTTGCSLLNLLLGSYDPYARRTVNFSDMKYERPDIDETLDLITKKAAIIDGSDGETHEYYEMYQGVLDAYNSFIEWMSMESLAYIHFSIDTSDSGWAEEMSFFDENSPKVRQAFEDIYVVCAQSEYKSRFESELFGEGGLEDYVDGGVMTDEIAELMQRESQLVTRFNSYDYMDTVFEVNGVSGTISDHTRNAYSDSDYDKIYAEFYKKVNQDTGPILIDLVKIRNRIASAAGYDSYAAFAFNYLLMRDYTPEQADKLVDDICEKVVPLYTEASDSGLLDIIYGMNAYPVSAGKAYESVEKALGGADKRLKESFDFMDKYDLCYLGYDSNQLSASYTTYIQKYDAPMTVILGTGNASDALTLAHEFGHFTDGYLNYGIINDLDLSEIASTSLEYLFLERLDQSGLSASEADAIRKYKKASTVDLYISQCLYYDFERKLYSLPEEELTLENVNGLAASIVSRFGDAPDFEFFRYSWSMIEHFYMQSFYVISYVTADSVSLQIAAMGFDKAGGGLDKYFELLGWDYSKSFTENIARAGLDSPFSSDAADKLVNNIKLVFG
ncbi:MAG: hypothetical protein J5950_01565 [Clostridia bacterium]|nr:hypothetical protein [Clostridia bacterium]